jgi:type IV pilus assembly protein PilE
MKKGFTLVELVIVIVIVGILSIVAVPIYRGYSRKSMTTEGKALLGVIQLSERAYFAENASYLGLETTDFNEELDIDVRSNKYFTTFTVSSNGKTGDNARYTAITTGNGGASGISLTIIGQPKGEISFHENGVNN